MSKIWILLALCSALLFGTTIFPDPTKKRGAGPLFRIHYGDKWGYMDRTGKTVIRPQFQDAGDFFEGLSSVRMQAGRETKLCFINEVGKIVITGNFDAVGDFADDLAPVRVGRLWGYIDRFGKMAVAPRFQGAAQMHDGLGRFAVWDRVHCIGGTYTKDDAPTHAFLLIDQVSGLPGCFPQYPRFGYINRSGEIAIEPLFFDTRDFSEGLAAIRMKGESKFAYIDKTGKIVIAEQFDQASPFSEGLAAVQIGFRAEDGKQVAGKWGFIDQSGGFVISPRFVFLFNFSDGLAPASDQLGDYGFIDRTGQFVIPPVFHQVHVFSEGLSGVWPKDGSSCVYIDKTGTTVLKLKRFCWPFSDGLTVAGEDGKQVYVDRNGRTVAPFEVSPK